MVTIRDGLLSAECLNYHQIQIGQYIKASVARVNTVNGSAVLKVNEFVQGSLHIEHMADVPLKTMPPKFQEVGKELNLRVLNVDAATRLLEFTKKDTLMKEDCPVYKSHKEIQKGDKFVGVVVSTNEYGHIVRSFGSLKGLLTFEDISKRAEEKAEKKRKASTDKSLEYKVGSIVKAYCLFKKAGKGIALTLSKKTAKASEEGDGAAAKGGGN